jgi:alpha-tubulin suppressor-like RCC1 family protein
MIARLLNGVSVPASRRIHASSLPLARILTFGRATEGQTGVPSSSAGPNKHHGPMDPTEGTLSSSSITASASASGLVASGGRVFVCGRGPLGHLGLGSSMLSAPSLCSVDLPDGSSNSTSRILMSSNANHTAFLSADGKSLAMAGSGAEGQLALGGALGIAGSYHGGSQPTAMHSPVPVSIPASSPIKDIALSRHRTVFLTADGSVFVAGTGFSGELGLGTTTVTTSATAWHDFDAEADEKNHGFPEAPSYEALMNAQAEAERAVKANSSNKANVTASDADDDDEDLVDDTEVAASSHANVRGMRGGTDVSHPGVQDIQELRRRQQEKTADVSSGRHALPRFTAIGAALHYTLAASEDGRLFFCGRVGTAGKRNYVSEKDSRLPSLVQAQQASGFLSSLVPIPLALPGLTTTDKKPTLQIACGLHHAAITDGEGKLWLFGPGFQSDDGGANKELGVGPHLLHLERYIGFKPKSISVSCGPYSTAIIADGKLYLLGRIESPYLLFTEQEIKREEEKAKKGTPSSTGGVRVGEGLGLFEELLRNNLGASELASSLGGSSFSLQTVDFVATLPSPTLVRHPEINGDGKKVLAVALGNAHAIALVE